MKKAPEIKIPKAAPLPLVERTLLSNGLEVYVIASEGQEVSRVSFVWAAGTAVGFDRGVPPFVASSTLNLLAEGSERYTAHQIAEKLDFVGSYFEASADRDFAVMTFCSLEKFFEPTLDIMSEIVLHPTFPEDEVALWARKRMERLALERAKPAVKAREAFSAALFGPDHPYGISVPESEYLNLTREEIVKFRKRYYGARNCFVVCSLGQNSAHRKALFEILEQVESGELRVASWLRAKKTLSTPKSDRFLEISGAVQSAVRIGRVLFSREHPDFVGMQVVATILGGYFGSRLVQNLREQKGYTYGVMAAMVNLRHSGYLAVATEVAAHATEDAVEQIFAEMERLKVEPVGADELENVKRSMLGEVMRILDGPFGVVDVVIENIQVGCQAGDRANDGGIGGGKNAGEATIYLDDFIHQVNSITPERVTELARKYLVREEFAVVVAGPSKAAKTEGRPD